MRNISAFLRILAKSPLNQALSPDNFRFGLAALVVLRFGCEFLAISYIWEP
jgi:hypothetical protein